MVTYTLKEYVTMKGFTQIAKAVRENTNGYPFITFISADNKAENVYFSINAAETVAAGEIVTAEMLQSLQVVETQNAQGEQRTKLSLKGESARFDLADLL